MNLRKLLVGLLALCLLLTMAPVALMEEAAPEEVVIELGDAVEAEEAKIDPNTALLFMYEDYAVTGTLEIDVTDDPITLTTSFDATIVPVSGQLKVIALASDGTITPLKKGTAKIKAIGTADEVKGETVTLKIKVTDKHAVDKVIAYADDVKDYLKIDPTDEDFSTEIPLTASIQPLDYHDGDFITWSVNKASIASFDEAGVVSAIYQETSLDEGPTLYIHKAGTVKVTAKADNGKKDTVKIEILDKSGIVINDEFEDGDYLGAYELYDPEDLENETKATVDLQATLVDWTGAAVNEDKDDLASITWKSSNKKVATVTKGKKGAATLNLVGTGTTKITAKQGKAKCTVTVVVYTDYAVESILVPTSKAKYAYYDEDAQLWRRITVGSVVTLVNGEDFIVVSASETPVGVLEASVHHPSMADIEFDDDGNLLVYVKKSGCTKIDFKQGGKKATYILNATK